MTLYELTGDFIKLLDAKKEIDDAEVQKDIEKSIKNKIIKKLEGYAKARQSINAEINALKEEEKRLQERRKKLEKRSSMIDDRIKASMLATEIHEITTPLFTLSIRPSKDILVIDDETSVPAQFFVPQAPKIDKNKLNEWAKNNPGRVNNFGHYEPVNSLIIK